jgi:DNA repair exonuclease SbcCD nuclease subunit
LKPTIINQKKLGILKKGLFFTDIHFGKKSNSIQHNEDCVNFIKWVINIIKYDDTIDYIAFLGDWNEKRNALNVKTLIYSYEAAKLLNKLKLPIFFVVGNHDLYHRDTREVHSIIPFNEFSNFHVIDHPTIIKNILNTALFCPYLFSEEYPDLIKHRNIPFWAGHFEFKGFKITKYGTKMKSGPTHGDFSGPTCIASGHFHIRQIQDNIAYIGSTFPMDFGDIGDNNRGVMIFDHETEKMSFIDWKECPKYTKTMLSDLLDGTTIIYHDSRVACVVDIPISYEESLVIKKKFMDDFNLREFTLTETGELGEILTETDIDVEWDNISESTDIDKMIHSMLLGIKSKEIKSEILADIYNKLDVQR